MATIFSPPEYIRYKYSVLICEESVAGITFRMPHTTEELLKHQDHIGTAFTPSGAFRRQSRYAERLALCLAHEGKLSEAISLFEVIVRDSHSTLFIDKTSDETPSYVAIADRPGKLGHYSLYKYASLIRTSRPAQARALLLEIVERTPAQSNSIILGDVRLETLRLLKKLGVREVQGEAKGITITIEEAIKIADRCGF